MNYLKQNAALAISHIILHAIDAVTTLIASNICEVNPVLQNTISNPVGLIGLKMAVATIATCLLLFVSKYYPKQIRTILIVVVGIMAVVCVINIEAL